MAASQTETIVFWVSRDIKLDDETVFFRQSPLYPSVTGETFIQGWNAHLNLQKIHSEFLGFYHVRQNRFLLEDKSLGEQSVIKGDVMVLVPANDAQSFQNSAQAIIAFDFPVTIDLSILNKEITFKEYCEIMNNKHVDIVFSGTFTQCILNIDSTLTKVTQTINSAPHLSEDVKVELNKELENLKTELHRVSADQIKQGEAVAKIAKSLIDEVTSSEPSKEVAQPFADTLLGAAKNIEKVMPIVTSIAKIALSIFGLPVPS